MLCHCVCALVWKDVYMYSSPTLNIHIQNMDVFMSQFSSVAITNWCFMFTAGGVLLFVTRKLDSEQVAANLQIQGYSGK